MKKNSIYSFLIGCIFLLFGIHAIGYAQTTRPTDKEAIEMQINQLVTELRRSREQSVSLNKSIHDYKKKLDVTQQKINNLNAVIDKRKQQSLERLRNIQLNDEFNTILQLLLTSQHIADFIQRVILLSQLQEEANNRLYLAQQTADELQYLKKEQEELLAGLSQKQEKLLADMATIEQKRQELQQLVDQFPDVVNSIIAKNDEQTNHTNNQTSQSETSSNQQSTVSTTVLLQKEDELPSQLSNIQKETIRPISILVPLEPDRFYSIIEFKRKGVITYKGNKFTYYSELVLPGMGLNIPGRHVNAQGYVVDKDGYIVLANEAPIGTIIDTPFGAMGKVYDRGTYGNHYDVYLR